MTVSVSEAGLSTMEQTSDVNDITTHSNMSDISVMDIKQEADSYWDTGPEQKLHESEITVVHGEVSDDILTKVVLMDVQENDNGILDYIAIPMGQNTGVINCDDMSDVITCHIDDGDSDGEQDLEDSGVYTSTVMNIVMLSR